MSNVGNGLDAQGVEDEGDCLDNFGVVPRQGWIPDDLHQGCDGHGRVEVVQTSACADIDKHLAWTHFVALMDTKDVEFCYQENFSLRLKR